jgi:hypothetical protein
MISQMDYVSGWARVVPMPDKFDVWSPRSSVLLMTFLVAIFNRAV